MSKENFKKILIKEVERIDNARTSKRQERVIEGFTNDSFPKAIINGKEYLLFNSNDYLGLRFHKNLHEAEKEGSAKHGLSPGAVRFISGTHKVHKDLEKAIAKFHGKEDAIIFSSAFTANLSILHSLIKGQSSDSLVSSDTLVVSDELNHRSIIEGIRVANLEKEQKAIFKHLDYESLREILQNNVGKFSRVIVVTDGIFSMLGESQNLREVSEVIREYDGKYEQGITLMMDDAHGVGCFGESGRGCEELSGVKADILIGTLGKAFGKEGGYATAGKAIIDYLRESAASYIYSNSITPGSASAALESIKIVDSPEGKALLERLNSNISMFKEKMKSHGFKFVADSSHAIQPVLIGNTEKAKALTEKLFESGIVVTNINFPVVPRGNDEIRVQLSALHTEKEIEHFVSQCSKHGKELGIIK